MKQTPDIGIVQRRSMKVCRSVCHSTGQLYSLDIRTIEGQHAFLRIDGVLSYHPSLAVAWSELTWKDSGDMRIY